MEEQVFDVARENRKAQLSSGYERYKDKTSLPPEYSFWDEKRGYKFKRNGRVLRLTLDKDITEWFTDLKLGRLWRILAKTYCPENGMLGRKLGNRWKPCDTKHLHIIFKGSDTTFYEFLKTVKQLNLLREDAYGVWYVNPTIAIPKFIDGNTYALWEDVLQKEIPPRYVVMLTATQEYQSYGRKGKKKK